MDKEIDIHLADRCARFVQQQIGEGHFDSPAQVVETALLMLEERETKRALLLALFEQVEHADSPNSDELGRLNQRTIRRRP